MTLMKKTDQWSGVVLLIISAFICWESSRMPYGSIHNPGAGLFPFWLGVILGGMSIGLIMKTTLEKDRGKRMRDLLSEKIRWGKILALLIALVLYGYGMDLLGFLIITFLFMAFLLRFIDPQSWKSVIIWALGGSIGCYLIFDVWLKLRLPKGFLGG
jgi:putative tricarboxylic transport membrane protein